MSSPQNLEQLKNVLGDTHNIEEILDEEVQTRTHELREYNCELLKEITELKIKEAQASHMALFPQENPNPVFRVSSEGEILYANSASQFALDTWETGVGKVLPEFFSKKFHRHSVSKNLWKWSARFQANIIPSWSARFKVKTTPTSMRER